MKSILTIALVWVSACSVLCAKTFVVPEVGVSITCPNGWKHDAKDNFGFVIKVVDKRQKIRIHLTNHKDITTKAAAAISLEWINKRKVGTHHADDVVYSNTEITTLSGLQGTRNTIGSGSNPEDAYLNRCYFKLPDGRIFCVCIYFYKDKAFEKEADDVIRETLKPTGTKSR
ncbi:MAG: hypothetical protein ABIP97_08700 [Chthoniobacterales bacterium]